MANRHTLHSNKLDAFRKWLIKTGWTIEEPKGIWEVLRAKKAGRQNPLIVYQKMNKEHLSVLDRDIDVIKRFLQEKGGSWMTQYCRYCCYLCVGDANYCSEKQQTMSDAVAKSPNRCHSFALNPIDAFGENERGYKPREPKKKQCDGQMRLEV